MAVSRVLVLVLTGLVFAPSAHTQQPADPEATTPEEEPKTDGRFRLGPVYLTPFFRLGTLGLDTNVFYTATDRQTDLLASGGPGLELVVPFSKSFRAQVRGSVNYLYFVRTSSQRRFGGDVVERLEWKRGRTALAVEETRSRSFRRPSFEIDTRVVEDLEATRVNLNRALFGRIKLRLEGRRAQRDVVEDARFFGVDLARTLTDRTLGGRVGLEYVMTPKTSALAYWDHERHRFPLESTRDGSIEAVMGGLETDATALVSGHALAGVTTFASERLPGRRRGFSFDLDATLNVSPRTRVGGMLSRGLSYSAFAITTATPTVRLDVVGLRLEREIVARRVDVRLLYRRTRFVTDGAVRLERADGTTETAVRDDVAHELACDAGYRFPWRLRVGVVATYARRRSTFADFGIAGLLLGASVTYTP